MTMPTGMPADTRPRFEFDVPETARMYPEDPRKVVMVPLRVSDDLEASAIAQARSFNAAVLTLEQIRRSVVAIDGKQIDWAVPGGAEWIERTSPPLRDLLIKAYNKIHTAPEDASKAFLASMKAVAA